MLKNFINKKILILFGAFTLLSCKKQDPIVPQDNHVHTQEEISSMARLATENLTMGNPSNAVTSTTSPTNYLLSKTTWAASYNRDLGRPNWVSWHLNSTWLGSATRCDCFASDATLPTGWYRVTSTSYTGSGFDRGHNCPSGDRTYNSTDNRETFLMTNMMPQAPLNNQQTWEKLESYCRKLVTQGNECYIICGSYGVGGTGSAGYKTTLDAGRVTVPSNIWKVVLVIPNGTNDVSRVTTSTRVIAVNTPNTQSIVTSTWGGYRVSVDAIEAATGYDILSVLPDAIEATLESRVDNGATL
jgi:endonuclease G